MAVCLISERRRRSIEYPLDEMTPFTDVDFKKVPVVPTVTPEFVDKKPIEYYVKECYENCEVAYGSSGTNYTYCVIGCSLGGQKPEVKVGADVDYKKVPVVPTFTPEVVDKKPVEFYVKECYDRCAVAYKPTDPDFSYCLLGCTVGGQKLDKVDFAINPFTPVREAHALTACEKKCEPERFFLTFYLDCMIKCQRGRSLTKPLEIVSVPVVAVPEVGDFFKVCYEKCVAAYGLSGPDFTSCLFKCTIGGGKKPYVSNVVVVKPVVGKREARGYQEYQECIRNCLAEMGVAHHPTTFTSCPITCIFR
jgi:hypothetical protein